MVAAQDPGRHTVEAVDEVRDGHLRWIVDQKVNMVGLAVELHQFGFEVAANLSAYRLKMAQMVVSEYSTPVLRDEDQVHVEHEHAVAAVPQIGTVGHRPRVGWWACRSVTDTG
jgi:hypothetical protein